MNVQPQPQPAAGSRVVPTSVKEYMLVLFYEQASDPNRPRVNTWKGEQGPLKNFGGYVGLNIMQISKRLTERMGRLVDPHDVTHALYNMRDSGWVRFRQSKARSGDKGKMVGGGEPVRIQLTKRGSQKARGLVKGGYRALSETATPQPATPQPAAPKTNGHSDEPPERPNAIPEEREPAIDLSHFPAIRKVAAATSLISEAVRMLNLAGQGDLATMALDSIKERTPLENEVSLLVRDLAARGLVTGTLQRKGGEASEE